MDFSLITNTYLDMLRDKFPDFSVKYNNRGGDNVYTQDHLHLIRLNGETCYVHYEESNKVSRYYVSMEVTRVQGNQTALLVWVNDKKLGDFSPFVKQVSKYGISTDIKVSGIDSESEDISQDEILTLLQSYVDSL